MKYVTINLGFKSGRSENHRIEIEPHETENMKNALKTIEGNVYDYFDGTTTTPATFFLDTTTGRLLVDIRTLESFSIDDFDLQYK